MPVSIGRTDSRVAPFASRHRPRRDSMLADGPRELGALMPLSSVRVLAVLASVSVVVGCSQPASPAGQPTPSGGPTARTASQGPVAGGTVVMGLTNDASILNPNL